jgi:hypothetical protein
LAKEKNVGLIIRIRVVPMSGGGKISLDELNILSRDSLIKYYNK